MFFGSPENTVPDWQTLQPETKDFPLWKTLLEYQRKGVEWMRLKEAMAASGSPNRYISKGGMLLDDMGLGKTLQLIALCHCGSSQKPTLVICPRSIITQWCSEIDKRAVGHFWTRAVYRRSGNMTLSSLKQSAFVICSYEQVISRPGTRNMLHEIPFGRMILDEGTFEVVFRFSLS